MNKIDFKKQWDTLQIEQQPDWPNQQEYQKVINILDDNGSILIQIPDFHKNNLNLLLGDQYYFFSSETINNIANIGQAL